MDRETGKVIRDLEAILRAIIEVQRNDKSFVLNDEEKIEIAIFQLLLQRSRLHKKAGCHYQQI